MPRICCQEVAAPCPSGTSSSFVPGLRSCGVRPAIAVLIRLTARASRYLVATWGILRGGVRSESAAARLRLMVPNLVVGVWAYLPANSCIPGSHPSRLFAFFAPTGNLQFKWQCYDAYCRVCLGLGLLPGMHGPVVHQRLWYP